MLLFANAELALLNRKNQNAVDVAFTNQNIAASTKKRLINKHLRKQLREANRTRKNLDKKTTDHGDGSSAIDKIEKAKDATLIAAILIATVTFAAAFTMPGGYVSSDSSDPHKAGTAILAKKAAFQAFIVTDTIAMLLSTGAVLSHILAVLHLHTTFKLLSYVWAAYLTAYAMLAMMIAFVTGTYAVLEDARGLAIAVCVLVVLTAVLYFWFCATLHETFDMFIPKFNRPKKEAKNDLSDAV